MLMSARCLMEDVSMFVLTTMAVSFVLVMLDLHLIKTVLVAQVY